jgi:hypothetical protein
VNWKNDAALCWISATIVSLNTNNDGLLRVENMNRFIRTRCIPTVVVVGTLALAWSLFTRRSYENVRADVNRTRFAVVQMGPEATNFLFDVQSNWICKLNLTNDAEADTIRVFGFAPSVANLIRCQNYEMPAYSWFSATRNRDEVIKGLHKMPIKSVDKIFHVSQDRKVAFIRREPTTVYVFRDIETGELGVTIYVDKHGTGKATHPTNL